MTDLLSQSQLDRAAERRRICKRCKPKLDCVFTWEKSERDDMLNRPESMCPLDRWPK